MALTKMEFSPATGLRDTVTYPKDPADETAAREQVQGRLDEIKNFLNNTMTAEVDAHLADIVTDTDGVHGLKVEEGTFTPILAGSITAGVNTYSIQLGKYYKIGNQVTCYFAVVLSAKDAAMAGIVNILGLPFVVSTTLNYSPGGSIGVYWNITLEANYTQLMLMANSGASAASLRQGGTGLAGRTVDAGSISNTSQIYGSITYLV